MRRLAIPVFLLAAALGAQVDAGQLPTASSLVGRERSTNLTHYVRGGQDLPTAASLVGREKS